MFMSLFCYVTGFENLFIFSLVYSVVAVTIEMRMYKVDITVRAAVMDN